MNAETIKFCAIERATPRFGSVFQLLALNVFVINAMKTTNIVYDQLIGRKVGFSLKICLTYLGCGPRNRLTERGGASLEVLVSL
ncbi:hypothetical protein, partial [Rhizobium oryziradicis]|uniref:hypothetical protein n=1 Tax=Rhizobium oryziradicis TaxID=1867956 RepID=UPI001AECF22A